MHLFVNLHVCTALQILNSTLTASKNLWPLSMIGSYYARAVEAKREFEFDLES